MGNPASVIGLNELKKLITEANHMGIDPRYDPMLSELQRRREAAEDWKRRAKRILADPKFPSEHIRRLIDEGSESQLRVRLDDPSLMEKLRERCKCYCLCQIAFDELKPMITCDQCRELYHYECVGMPPPPPGTRWVPQPCGRLHVVWAPVACL